MRIHHPDPSAPAGTPTLRLDQLEAIYRIKREVTEPGRSKSVLVGAGMGSGKTVVSVEVILKTDPNRCLIVGVRDAYSQWSKTLKEQGGTRPLQRIINTPDGRENLRRLVDGERGIYYVGLEMLRAQDWEVVSETWSIGPEIVKMFGGAINGSGEQKIKKQKHTYTDMEPIDLLFSDESHKHSNQQSASIKTMRTIPAVAKVALSGTFFGNKIINAWTTCTWLWGKKIIGGKGAFERDFCIVEPLISKSGRPVTTPGGFPLTKNLGERNPGEYVETLPCYVFIATPIGDVPDPEIVKYDLGAEEQRQYDEMLDQSLTWIPTAISSVREPLVADLDLTQRLRLRTAALGAMTLIPSPGEGVSDKITFSPGGKSEALNAAYKVLHRPAWVGKKALILTHSKPFAEEIARRIGKKYSVALKTGETKNWDDDKDRFMLPVSETDSIQYLVAVISAVGTATDGLQAQCAKVLWVSEDENNVNNIQGSNRVWRDGVDLDEYESVKLVARDTIAEGILKKNDLHRGSVLDSVKGSK